MRKSKNLVSISMLTISILILYYIGPVALAQTAQIPTNTAIRLPIVINGGSLGFDPPEIDTEFEQIFFGPLAAVSDHLRQQSYTSGVSFFNPYSVATTVNFNPYDTFGSPSGTGGTQIIPQYDGRTIFPLEGTSAIFTEMSANYPITAVYRGSRNFDADTNFAHVAPVASTQIYLPLLCKCEYETVMSIKNTNDVEAIVTIEYSDGERVGAIIPPHAHRLIYQYFEEHGSEPFSGKLSSSVAISAAVLQTDSSTSRGYAGIADSSAALIFPLVSFESASTTFAMLQIQNVGSTTTEVGVAYTSASTDAGCTETQTVDAGASVTFGGVTFNNGENSDCALGGGFIGSARVVSNSSDQPLVGVVDQFEDNAGIGSYGAVSEEEATYKLAFPSFIKSVNGDQSRSTVLRIVNVGSTDSNVSCSFVNTEQIEAAFIPAGGSATITLDGEFAGTSINSATCVGYANTKLVAVADTRVTLNSAGKLLSIYRGINF